MKAKYLILFLILALIFNLGLACGEVSTKSEKVEELTEADIEEKYISEITIITSALANSLEKYIQANYDFVEGKISLAEHKAIVKKYIEEVKACYDMYQELKPSKKLEKYNNLFGKAMYHDLKSTKFLQIYIDTDNDKKMAKYIERSTKEGDLANEYYLKAFDQMKKLTE